MPATYQDVAIMRVGDAVESFYRMYEANYQGDQRRFKEQAQQYVESIHNEFEKIASVQGLQKAVPLWFNFIGQYEQGAYQQGLATLGEFVATYMELPRVREAYQKR